MNKQFQGRWLKVSGVYGTMGLALAGLSGCGNEVNGSDCEAARTCAVVAEAGASGQAASKAGEDGGGGTPNGGVGAGAASTSGGTDDGASIGGAQGGEGGEGGEGGALPVEVPECTSDAECDDSLACNGAEECDAGHCISGTPPVCANPDEANCSVGCVEGANDYSCVVTANDADHDGHGSALCSPSPGDDCDDTHESVFAGAPELCDGLDNDCDRKLDLADGLEFSGDEHWVGRDVDSSIRAEKAVVAWSDAAQLYGMAWKVRGLTDLVVALYGADGSRKAGPTTVGHSSVEPLAIAAGATGFAVAWNSDDAQETQFRPVNAKGELGTQVSVTGRLDDAYGYASLAMAWSGLGKRWEIAAGHGVGSVSESGAPQPFVEKFPAEWAIQGVEVVAAGNSFLIGLSASEGETASPHLYRYAAGSNVTPAKDQLAFDNPNHAQTLHVAAHADGSFAAVASAFSPRKSQVTAFDANGKRKCGYAESEFVSGLSGTGAGYTLALVALPTAGSLRELTNACSAGALVPTGFTSPYQPSLVASPTSYCNIWSDDDGNSFYSIFGLRYCD